MQQTKKLSKLLLMLMLGISFRIKLKEMESKLELEPKEDNYLVDKNKELLLLVRF